MSVSIGVATYPECGPSIDMMLNSADAAFGDFDEDGDIDLFLANSDGPVSLNANQRQGVFRDITLGSGLGSEAGSNAVPASSNEPVAPQPG